MSDRPLLIAERTNLSRNLVYPHESNKYGVTHYTIVEDVHSKMKNEETIETKEFFCPEDPNSVGFRLLIKFGCEISDWISLRLRPLKMVTRHSLSAMAYDSHGSCLVKLTSLRPRLLRCGFVCGWDQFLTIDKTSPAKLKIIVECQYAVDPDKSSPQSLDLRLKFQSDLVRALLSNTATDVTFIVQGEQIKAHKAVLVARSNYFSTMFDCDMKESITKEVEITDVQPKVFTALLGFLCGVMPEETKCEDWTELLVAADKYDLQELKDLCEASIIRCLSIDNIFEALFLADSYDCRKLRVRAQNDFKTHADILKKSGKWCMLKSNPDLLLELLECCTE